MVLLHSTLEPLVVYKIVQELSRPSPFLRKLVGRKRMGIFRALLTFSLGVYAGMYAAQNYEVPKVDEPSIAMKKLSDYLEQYKKDK
jgi:hypothetical protein